MTLAAGDLTTIATVSAYLTNATSSAVLQGLITRISRMVLTELNRGVFVPKDYAQQFNGTGTRSLVLPNYPVLDVSTLYINGASMNVANQDNDAVVAPYGFRFQAWDGVPPGDPLVLEFVGGALLWPGGQNVVVNYRAGYQVTDEAQTIPSVSAYTITTLAPYGIWATDEGVTYANGTALTPTTSATPGVGQYLPPAPDISSPRLFYTFNSADAGAGVLLSYGFVPADVEQAVIELIMDRTAYRARPGLRSQSLAGQETITYETSALSKFVSETLGGYKSVLPPAIGANV